MKALQQQLDFLMQIDQLKAIYRQTTVKNDNDRQENSAEHSWHIALVAQVLQQYAAHNIDINRVTLMLLIHDIIEIDAGDLFAFAPQQHHQEQALKELAAAERLFGLLPHQQGEQMKTLWIEFEQAKSVDAQFAKAMDRILPLFQNMANHGGSWVKHSVKKQQILARNSYLQESAPKLWEYTCAQVDLAVNNGWLIDSE
ncbi:HD domain-containing protein [Psychromonas hadalis]|uniref:HD domain-containing protein n=1 Tax=Psychromonas hadalis TaxID=211669 RepID=UPI0003B77A8A|nr:HD domain-containing protein [Psychromonas hadalis]